MHSRCSVKTKQASPKKATTKKRIICPRRPDSDSPCNTLEQIVKSYLGEPAKGAKECQLYYARLPSLKEAISQAALARIKGKKISHQWRIPNAVLEQGRDALLKHNYKKIDTFEKLYDLVNQTLRPIRGIGDLAIYDTAHRIGAKLKLYPEHVYLHAGVKVGARALGLPCNQEKLPMNILPKAFQRLSPGQAEDCLCIYKADLKAWATRKQ